MIIDFEGKVAYVTGGAMGLGAAMVKILAESNAAVALVDINEDAGKQKAAELRNNGLNVQFFKADVVDKKCINEVFGKIEDTLGNIFISVNNAGVSSIELIEDMEEKHWDYNMDINSKGIFLCSQEAVRRMRASKTKGRIINTASAAAKYGVPGLLHYSAAKAAVLRFSQSLALEVAKDGITVNSICPGFHETPMLKREEPWWADMWKCDVKEVRKRWLETIPLGRFGTAEDIAKVVLFLASPLADYITGESINITGGNLME
jgi:meso-butanediol dehydrogenase / (S,S)-butanediol dehydrogenase / diacetyl reductase